MMMSSLEPNSNFNSGGALDVATAIDSNTTSSGSTTTSATAHSEVGGLDTLHGVVLPSLQSILGVLLFLRLTHVTSQAGCIHTSLLLLLSTSSTLFTWSSLSAIVTNGSIRAGGPYYIISRTLGADIGCSLGVLYYVGNTLSGSMFVLGAVEAVQHSVRSYYARWGYGFSGHVFPYDVQILGFLAVIGTASCVHVGTRYVTLFSNLFLGATLVGVGCMCLGCALFAMGKDVGRLQPYDRGHMENLWPRYERDPYTGVTPDFFSCLALIYPSVTGILSGLSKTSHLKHPSQSIPNGILIAILSSTSVYLLVCWLFGTTFSNRILKVDKFISASASYPHEMIVRIGVGISCMGSLLQHLSTAPTVLAAISSDNVLPFLSWLRPAAEEEEGSAAPIKALWLSALLVALPTLCGNLDRVSPYTTIFYLLMYAGINIATCVSGYVRPPGFRPTFKYFHWSVSFVGFVWCLTLSFLISGVATFCSLLVFLLFKAYVKKSRRLAATGMKWGTLGSAVRYNIVSSVLTSLAKHATNSSYSKEDVSRFNRDDSHSTVPSSISAPSDEHDEWIHFQQPAEFHAKNFRPQLLTIVPVDFQGTPCNLHVLSIANQFQQMGRGISVVISIIDRSATTQSASIAAAVNDICSEKEDDSVVSRFSSERWRNERESMSTISSGMDHQDTIHLIRRSKALLMMHMKKEGMDGFAEVSTTDGKFFEAVWSAVIHTGLGPLSPNTILLSFPSFESAGSRKENDMDSYMRTLSGILNLGKAVILFKGSDTYPTASSDIVPGRKCIDIWWVVYDGGLLLLLPYLLSKHSVWCNEEEPAIERKSRIRRRRKVEARLRIFVVCTSSKEDPDALRVSVVDHLERMRIQAEVIVIDALADTNIAEHMRDSSLAGSSRINNSSSGQRSNAKCKLNRVASLTQDGISTHHMTIGEVFVGESLPEDTSTNKYYGNEDEGKPENTPPDNNHAAVLLNKTIKKHSGDANLVVTNLPFIPNEVFPNEYFGFVDAIVDGIDNVLLVRGSGAEVITSIA